MTPEQERRWDTNMRKIAAVFDDLRQSFLRDSLAFSKRFQAEMRAHFPGHAERWQHKPELVTGYLQMLDGEREVEETIRRALGNA